MPGHITPLKVSTSNKTQQNWGLKNISILQAGREIWKFLWSLWKSQAWKWVHLSEFLLSKLYVCCHPEVPLPGSCNAWSHVDNEAGTESRLLVSLVGMYICFVLWAVSDPGEHQENQDLNCNLNQIVLFVDSGHYSCLGKSLNSGLLKTWVLGPKKYSSNN